MNPEKTILIPIPALFSFKECLWFLDRNYDDCLHVIKGDLLYKAVLIGEEKVLFCVKEKGSMLEVSVLKGEFSETTRHFLTEYVLEWFDMSRHIQPFYDLLQLDGRIAYMAREFSGLRLIGISSIFEAICWSIIGQQINLSFAYRVKRRLVEAFGESVLYEGEHFYIFPKAEILANVPVADYKSMQFSERKAEYVIGIAKQFAEGTVSRDILLEVPDFDARKKFLTQFKGIGIWTANYALMKSLREPEGIPYGDIGLLNALSSHDIIQDRSEAAKIDALFAQFKGWETYLVFYLWRSLTFKN